MADDASRCAVSRHELSAQSSRNRGFNDLHGSQNSAKCRLVRAQTKSEITRAELRNTERRYRRWSLLLSGC